VSGGHHEGFEAVCDDLATRIGASRAVVEGAGHELQFTGPPINEALLALWRGRLVTPSTVAERGATATEGRVSKLGWRHGSRRIDAPHRPTRHTRLVLGCAA
jgi:hypothetical protein